MAARPLGIRTRLVGWLEQKQGRLQLMMVGGAMATL